MSTKPRLYLAGTISGDPRPFEEKKEIFYGAAALLLRRGYDVLVPLDVPNTYCHLGEKYCGSSTRVATAGTQQNAHSWECLLRNDLIEALKCDGVALLPGWEVSPGVRLEFDTLTRVGLPAKPLDEWPSLTLPSSESVLAANVLKIPSSTPPEGHIVFSDRGIFFEPAEQSRACARCRIHESNHAPGGSRFGCDYAGPGTTSECGACKSAVTWTGRAWTDEPNTSRGAYCPDSTDPDPTHKVGGDFR